MFKHGKIKCTEAADVAVHADVVEIVLAGSHFARILPQHYDGSNCLHATTSSAVSRWSKMAFWRNEALSSKLILASKLTTTQFYQIATQLDMHTSAVWRLAKGVDLNLAGIDGQEQLIDALDLLSRLCNVLVWKFNIMMTFAPGL